MTNPSIATTSQYPKARWWASVGITVAVLGAALSTIWFVWALNRVEAALDDLQVVEGGTEVSLTITDAVDWTIYLEPVDRSLSGVRFSIEHRTSGQVIPLTSARNEVNYEVGSRSGRPVSRALLEPGEYLIELRPDDATLAIGPDVGETVQVMWLGALLIGLPTVLGGGMLAAINLARALRPPSATADEGTGQEPPPPVPTDPSPVEPPSTADGSLPPPPPPPPPPPRRR